MRILFAIVALLLAPPGAAQAANIVINNGLAPPNPENVIDYVVSDHVRIRNVGCPPAGGLPWDPCPSPGAPTEVALVPGGDAIVSSVYESSTFTMSGGTVRAYYLFAVNSSTITMSGGFVSNDLRARDSATITMSGGRVGRSVHAYDSSAITVTGGYISTALLADDSATITMSGGSVIYNLIGWGSSLIAMTGGSVGNVVSVESSAINIGGGEVSHRLWAKDSSTITVVGRDFAVDGVPVPYGDLTAMYGALTGALASGDAINTVFHQGGWTGTGCYSGNCDGTITLVRPPAIATEIDIKPGSCPNSWNRESNGVLPVAILGTEDFDVTEIDVSSVTISRADGTGGSVGPNEGPPGPHSDFEDVGTPFEGEECDCHEAGGDGILDLVAEVQDPACGQSASGG